MAHNVWALVHFAKKGRQSRCGISFPDFPGAVSGGRSVEEAIERGRATLAYHIAGLAEDGASLPIPRSLDELRSDPDVQEATRKEGAVIVQVPIELPGKQVRVNISIDDGLLASIDRAATQAGKTRSGFIAEAAQARLKGAP
jgi:predicted RNase H-like HicB family nuclease